MAMKPRDLEVFITGQARSGTSLLLMTFALNGVRTGYSDKYIDKFKEKLTQINPDKIYGRSGHPYLMRGGLEYISDFPYKLRTSTPVPYVIKHPYTIRGKNPERALKKFGLVPKNVIMTRRDIDSLINSKTQAAISRNKYPQFTPEQVFNRISKQVPIQYKQLEESFPDAIWVEFPRYVTDFDYLWDKVGHLMNNANYTVTKREFEELADVKLVRH